MIGEQYICNWSFNVIKRQGNIEVNETAYMKNYPEVILTQPKDEVCTFFLKDDQRTAT